MEVLLEHLARGILTMLSISMPCVLTAAAIGLVVGVLQAITQVQEQTIAAAPKILAVFLVILLGGVGFVKILTNLFLQGAELAFNGVSKSGYYVLDSNYYKYTRPFTQEMQADSINSGQVNQIMKHPDKAPFIDNNEKVKYYPSNRSPNPRPNFVETNKIIGR